ncbi:MAG: type II toxin-antitoxin system death-on-curing family toxin, partial [Synergistes sp.]|nr:type II toxin-antitoxin system death-on-curing family toxin [Synergistes sp.]
PSLFQKAARLGCGLVQNHAFIDGNKRIAAHAMLLFLALNGVELCYEQHELADIFLRLASGEAKYEQLLVWITEHET